MSDRQPITSRTALLTRAAGEQLAAAAGEDVSSDDAWWLLLARVVPQQVRSVAALYQLMPKQSLTKLKLL